MRRDRRQEAGNLLSFLDVISCSFGAMVLLLVITGRGDEAEAATQQPVSLLSQQTLLFALRAEVATLRAEIATRERALTTRSRALDLARQAATREEAKTVDAQRYLDKLRSARQRLYQSQLELKNRNPSEIGGLPVDSDYVIFVIDTSGSMLNQAWRDMVELMNAILSNYPDLKGIQVLNDMGEYMFGNYRGRWMEDNPGRRAAIARALPKWRAFSNSSPLEGIEAALRDYRRYAKPERRISVFVFGDSFAGIESIPEALALVDRLNPPGADGQRAMRIHAVGFPVGMAAQPDQILLRYAVLMREMTQRHNGSFIGLNALK